VNSCYGDALMSGPVTVPATSDIFSNLIVTVTEKIGYS